MWCIVLGNSHLWECLGLCRQTGKIMLVLKCFSLYLNFTLSGKSVHNIYLAKFVVVIQLQLNFSGNTLIETCQSLPH